MILFQDQNRQIRPNFTEQELYSTSKDAPPAHQLTDQVIDGVQIIRDWLGKPVTVNSTYRTKAHNDSIGSNDKSQHRISTAIDLTAAKNDLEKVKHEIRSQSGELWNRLRAAGVVGFGVYKGFVHIDSRTTGGKQQDMYGSYAFWDSASKTAEKKKDITEDGNITTYKKASSKKILIIAVVIILICAAAIIYIRKWGS